MTPLAWLLLALCLELLVMTSVWDRRIQARRREFDRAIAEATERGAWLLLLGSIDHGWTYPRPKEGKERRTKHDAGRG